MLLITTLYVNNNKFEKIQLVNIRDDGKRAVGGFESLPRENFKILVFVKYHLKVEWEMSSGWIRK